MPESPFAFARPDLPTLTPRDTQEAGEIIASAAAQGRAVLARGGGTKWSAGRQPPGGREAVILSTAAFTGIVEYNPAELTFTARAGTPLAEVQAALAANRQYLPFDPPFAGHGATLGGTVAAGLSGPRRMRYGGLRDFIIGIDYLDASGQVVRSGGKVVKNAAGYDFAKLFCGSLGTLGVAVQVSFKVFPVPQASLTAVMGLKSAQAAQELMRAVARSTLEVSAADAWDASITLPGVDTGQPYTLAIQIDGAAKSLMPRLDGLRALLPKDTRLVTLEGEAEAGLWATLRDVTWVGDAPTILHLYLPPSKVATLDALLAEHGAQRAYSAAGNLGWAALAGDPKQLGPGMERLGVRASIWRTPTPSAEIIPALPGAAMVHRVKRAFDPKDVFYPGRYRP